MTTHQSTRFNDSALPQGVQGQYAGTSPAADVVAIQNAPNASQQSGSSHMPNTRPALPVDADDRDLIEPEWITVVRRILREYQDDPHALSEEMATLRADYMKKRYEKDITIVE